MRVQRKNIVNPAGLTDRQRRFAEFVAAGEPKVAAYALAGYRSTGDTGRIEASKLMKKPAVRSYLDELRGTQRSSAILTRQRRREILCLIIEGKIPGVTVADRIRAIQVDNAMTGDNQPIRIEGEITLATVLAAIDADPMDKS